MRKERLSVFICADHYGTSRSNFNQPWNNTCPEEKGKYSLLFIFRPKYCSTVCWSQYIDTIVYQFRTGILPAHIPQNTEFTGCGITSVITLCPHLCHLVWSACPPLHCFSVPSDSMELEHLDLQGSCAPTEERCPLLKWGIQVTCINDRI